MSIKIGKKCDERSVNSGRVWNSNGLFLSWKETANNLAKTVRINLIWKLVKGFQ